ncbi:MAG: DUF2237 domain-containing protein [Verrucomicrobiota bacterium]
MNQSNVLGTPLQSCSNDPITGYRRDGHCAACPGDHGQHTLCATVTDRFLEFSRSRGNDLTTPRPEFGFPGLVDGNRWCLCVTRWLEAYEAGCAPPVKLEATHLSVLEYVDLEVLREFAAETGE